MENQKGWFDDPHGRYLRRYYDGENWTDQVQTATGEVVTETSPGVAMSPPNESTPVAPFETPSVENQSSKGKSKKKVVSIVLGVLLVLGVIGAIFGAEEPSSEEVAVEEDTSTTVEDVVETTTSEPSPESSSTVELPELTGVDEQQATKALGDLGLTVITTEVESDQAEGTVVLQNPRAGEEVEPGEEVEVFIAIPQTHTLTVIYQVSEGLYEDVGDDRCEYSDGGAAAGQKVSLIGPNLESLGVVVIEPGLIRSLSLSDDEQTDETYCYLFFEFDNVAEVDSYKIALNGSANFSAVSLEETKELGWRIGWRTLPPIDEDLLSDSSDSTSATTSTVPSNSETPSTTEPSTSTTAPATTVAPTTTAPPSSSETVSQANARAEAASYLRYSNFSRQGLIDQLEYEGYSTEDATYGVDAQNADWFAQAVGEAESYLKYSNFSRSGLISQLEYEGFSQAEATHGVDAQNADWFAQAALEAQSYLDYGSFSRQELIDQLLYEGFSQAEAEYGVNAVGL